jgi:glycosyltransferase involved in cell wall biosynthesis
MSKTPTVSVIVPAFNAAATIRRALDSALAQTGCSLDVVVVDDGSTDATFRLLADYTERIRILRQANAGVASARNAAIEAARGDFVAFLDADDEWLPAKLEKQLSRFCPGVDVVYCGASYFTATGAPVRQAPVYLEGDVLPRLMDGNFIPTSSVVVRAQCFRPEVRFPSTLRLGEDYAMWVRLALRHRFGVVREPLVRFQVDLRSDKYPLSDHERAFAYIEQMLAENLDHGHPRRKSIRHMRASGCWNTAILKAREGRYLASARSVLRALRARPFGFRGLFHYLRGAFLVPPGVR